MRSVHTEHLWQFCGQLLPGEANEIGSGHHCYVVQDKYSNFEVRAFVPANEIKRDGGGHSRPEDVDEAGDQRGASEAYPQEVPGMETASVAFAGRVHASGKVSMGSNVETPSGPGSRLSRVRVGQFDIVVGSSVERVKPRVGHCSVDWLRAARCFW